MWILGVDGGGTKTAVAVSSPGLDRIVQETVGPTNAHVVGLAAAAGEIARGLRVAAARAGITPEEIGAATFGIAGLDHPRLLEAYREAVRPLLPAVEPARLRVANDIIIAYYSGTEADDGIAVIAGTGSHAYGRASDGREAFVGGLDWRLSDEGSGYWIGTAVLRAATRAEDGRGEATRLRDRVLADFGVASVRDLVLIVYEPAFDKAQVASLAALCDEVAAAGDAVALQILHAAAGDLAGYVLTAARRLAFPAGLSFPVVLAGSVFDSPRVRAPFEEVVRARYPRISFVVPAVPPVVGALRLAARLLRSRGAARGIRDSTGR